MAKRGIAGFLVDRLRWSSASATLDVRADRGWMARILACLFSIGGLLLLLTLLFAGAPDRESDRLALV